MGKRGTGERDQYTALRDGQFAGTGQSGAVELHGGFNVSLWGGIATIRPERSFDGGTTWLPLASDAEGTVTSWVTTVTGISFEGCEFEAGVLYRLNCTAFTSAVSYRISQ